jgi:hypothetical protein
MPETYNVIRTEAPKYTYCYTLRFWLHIQLMTIQGQFKYNYLQFHKMGCNITGKSEDPDFNPHPHKSFRQ